MKYLSLAPMMNERMRRQWAASEARAYGWGGVRAVSGAIGMSPNTIRRGLAELLDRQAHPGAPVDLRIRRVGGGRKALTENDPDLLDALEHLVDPVTRGDPESPLRWTCQSLRQLATQLTARGHQVSHTLVGELLMTNQKLREEVAALRQKVAATSPATHPQPRQDH